jgi:hypothetical protein
MSLQKEKEIMSSKRWSFACALCLLLFTALACKFSFSTANISGLKVSKDKEGNNVTSSFGPNDKVYAVAEVSNAPGKVKLKARLLFDSVTGQTSGAAVPGAETTIDLPGSGTGNFTFTPNAAGWPNGSYKIEVSMLNEENEQKDQKTAKFSVSGNTTAKSAPGETTGAPPTTQSPANANKDETTDDDQ